MGYIAFRAHFPKSDDTNSLISSINLFTLIMLMRVGHSADTFEQAFAIITYINFKTLIIPKTLINFVSL